MPKFTSWIIIQADDRPLSKDYMRAINVNKRYAAKHGYEYIFDASKSQSLPPYWVKVDMAYKVMKSFPNCKGVLWLDTDAFIVRQEMKIDNIFPNDSYDMVIAPDPPNIGPAPGNTGVWAVRNTEGGQEILKDWLNTYSPKYWRNVNNNWVAVNTQWARSGYEQGEFGDKVLPEHKDHIYIAPWRVLQNDKNDPETFTIHLLWRKKILMGQILDATT